jgi:hypothetical protein
LLNQRSHTFPQLFLFSQIVTFVQLFWLVPRSQVQWDRNWSRPEKRTDVALQRVAVCLQKLRVLQI